MFRKHQLWMFQTAQHLLCGTRIRKIVADVTPAGGKSALPIILGHWLLQRGLIDKIVVVSPRNALRTQFEEAAAAPWLHDLLGHHFEIKATENVAFDALDVGTAGYSTNYQSISADITIHLDYFRAHRVLLCLDEVHHLDLNGSWHKAVQPLYDLAAMRLIMSGTFYRHDEKQIAFVDYAPASNNRYEPVLHDTSDQFATRYSWRDAKDDRAIIKMYVEHLDGDAKWRRRNGDIGFVDRISEADEDDVGAAVFTALHEDYAVQLLANCVAHFNRYQRFHPNSRLLVIAPSIQLAKRYLKELKRLGIARSDIATSDDSDAAHQAIDRFKGKRLPFLDAMVTVGMAYEGLDVPEITHLALLTHIRSAVWITQALARAIRAAAGAGSWETQSAYIFAPDDNPMRECLLAYRDNVFPLAQDLKQPSGGGGGGENNLDPIIPLQSTASDRSGFAFDSGEFIDPGEYDIIEHAAMSAGIDGIDMWRLKDFLTFAQVDLPRQRPAKPETISQRIERKKRHIVRWIDRAMGGDGERIRRANAELIQRYGVDRDHCSEGILDQIIAALPLLFPLKV